MTRYIGIDLHRNRFTVCTLAGNGRAYHRTVEIRLLVSFAATLRSDDEVAVEMTTNTRLFKKTVEPYVAKASARKNSLFAEVFCRRPVVKLDSRLRGNDGQPRWGLFSRDLMCAGPQSPLGQGGGQKRNATPKLILL